MVFCFGLVFFVCFTFAFHYEMEEQPTFQESLLNLQVLDWTLRVSVYTLPMLKTRERRCGGACGSVHDAVGSQFLGQLWTCANSTVSIRCTC